MRSLFPNTFKPCANFGWIVVFSCKNNSLDIYSIKSGFRIFLLLKTHLNPLLTREDLKVKSENHFKQCIIKNIHSKLDFKKGRKGGGQKTLELLMLFYECEKLTVNGKEVI